MEKIKLVIFDMDGLMFETGRSSLPRLFKRRGGV